MLHQNFTLRYERSSTEDSADNNLKITLTHSH